MTATTHLRRAPGSPRRAGKRAAVVVAGVAVTVGAVWSVIGGATGDAGRSAPIGVPTATAPVERRDLVDRQDVDGALTFTGSRKILASTAGTVTRLRPEGSTVRRGQSLFSIDAKATAYVMYGSVPMYRALSAGVADGSDIRQLERNLVALGYDPYDALDVDSTWDSATTAAVLRWEKARGATLDGVVEQGDVVFSDGPARVGAHEADVGDPVSAHAPVLELTSRRRVVGEVTGVQTCALPISRRRRPACRQPPGLGPHGRLGASDAARRPPGAWARDERRPRGDGRR
jgi:hypothetical protein